MAEFIIADDAKPHIRGVYFDVDAYHGYLEGRGVSSENINNLDLIMTDEEVGPVAVANTTPAFLDSEGRHVIRISPTKLKPDISYQGAVLRHESEHFIQACDWRYRGWAIGQLGFIGVSSAGFATLMAHELYETAEPLPEPLRFGFAGIGVLGGIAIGVVASTALGKMFNPLEFQATIAQRRYRKQLPDGVLRVDYR